MSKAARVLVVEDEMIIAARISMHLETMGYEVVGILPRGEEAITFCQQHQPDILLMDIQLKGQLDGIETARTIQQQRDIPIIYLTSNSDQPHFERAKETLPYAFLSKPYQQLELQRALELVLSRMNVPAASPPRHSDQPPLNDRIFVRHNNTMVKVLLAAITHITAERSYCRIFTREAEYLLSMPLGSLEEKLSSDHFMRIHRSYIVNLTQVDTIHENSISIGDKSIPIGSAQRPTLLKRLPLI